MKKLLQIILILFITGQSLLAQTPHFKNYTVDDGLPSSHVYRSFQDSKGFIWFCTDKGVARFDGYKFETFTTKNGLPNNDIWQCAEDSQQRIWFLSYANAFFYFDLKDNKFHVIENPYKDYHDNHVWCYVQEGNDMMKVIISNHSIVKIRIKEKKVAKTTLKYSESYPLTKNKDFYMLQENAFELWHLRAYTEGLQHNILHKEHILPDVKLISKKFWERTVFITFDNDKTIYADKDSVCFFKGGKFFSKSIKNLSNNSDDKINLILNAGNKDRKLVVTDKDIFIINEKIERIKAFDFIKNFNINTVFFDNENNIWLCTKNRGVFLLSSNANKSKIFEDFSDKSITTLTKDNFGKLWIGNNVGELFCRLPDQTIHKQLFNVETQSPIKQIIASLKRIIILWHDTGYLIFVNNKKNPKKIYVKNANTVFRNDITGQTTYSKNSENYATIFAKQNVKTISIISNHRYLLGNSSNLKILEDLPNRYNSYYLGKSGKPTLKILAIKPFTNQTIFIGTNKGIELVDKTNKLIDLQGLKRKYPILTRPISCFADDSQNALWIGTDGYGVYRFHHNQATEIPELKGVIINYLYAEKENNRLWIATNEGIFLLKLDLKSYPFKYITQKISLAQGLPTLEVNCLVVRDNELFVGTSKGLAMLPIQNIIASKTTNSTVPLIIKNIKINRQDTTIAQYYTLNYRQNNLDIEFVALSFKSDKNIKYDYKMVSSNENADTVWHSVTDLHKEFSLLSSGRYEFSLRAFDIDGNATKTIKPIIFNINPPFWNTIWFKILSILLMFAAIILFFFIRTKNIKKQEKEKTKINKKFAELELQALQAQMNPHFVFNALSAIQNFILNNDAEEATDYLSRFSRLMRLFLESSRNKYIPISEEKILLEYYIQLEQLRFKDKFTFQITLEEGVSLDTEIPSLLLQPFVENAINHGLVYKNVNDGHLTINFRKEISQLICIIEDNGIGRQKAAEIKNKSLKPYKSRGTEITEERLRSLELIENTKIEINIFDKIDKNQIPQGTKVTIVMYL